MRTAMTDEMRSVIEENARHHDTLFPRYNPLTGEGSLEERFDFVLDDRRNIVLHLPVDMLRFKEIKQVLDSGLSLTHYRPKGVTRSVETYNQWRCDFLQRLLNTREKYDFEYWCYAKDHIYNKKSRKLTNFTLRAAQRKLVHILEQPRRNNEPIRVIVDKARQWGGSTCIQKYMEWIQLKWKQNWNSAIATQFQSQALTVRKMYEVSLDNYPKQEYTMSNYYSGNTSAKRIDQTGCGIFIGSLQNPDSLRSGDYSMAHYSEVGLWQETTKIKPEEFIASISASILPEPYTVIAYESTARGEGDFFHTQWMDAINGESGFAPLFVAWWEIEMYQKDFSTKREMYEFYQSLDDYGRYLWSLGATLEGINWYYFYKKKNHLTAAKMHTEFPSTWQESFVAYGQRVFGYEEVARCEKNVLHPSFVGDIVADAQKYAAAFEHIRFQENVTGCLKVWDFPDTKTQIDNRYLVCMDIGGRSAGADFTVIRVIDRYFRMEEENGADEVVASWRGHMDVDLAVWKAAQLAKAYNNALLVVESNTIDSKHQHTEGNHTYTVFDEIAEFYDNLYAREDEQRTRDGLPPRYGFFTGISRDQGKDVLITNLIACLRDDLYVEHDKDMIAELNVYEYKPDGTMGNKEGLHDDILMATAIGLFVSKKMPRPSASSFTPYTAGPSVL